LFNPKVNLILLFSPLFVTIKIADHSRFEHLAGQYGMKYNTDSKEKIMNENESLTVTLTLENNEELECAVLNIFEAEEKEYIALLPLDENGDNTDGQIYLYRFIDNGEEEEPGLENIEEDEEFDRVSAIFNEWLDTQDFGDIDLDALDDLED
jgi:uncharacterized protein YrzB (UPF0473 family)